MEPLRKCRTAKFFRPVPGPTPRFSPVIADPACSRCPMEVGGHTVPTRTACHVCGNVRVTLYDLDTTELVVPDVCADDFMMVLERSKATVATRELAKYEAFTKEFGSDGS